MTSRDFTLGSYPDPTRRQRLWRTPLPGRRKTDRP
jgi:hypothetical protein